MQGQCQPIVDINDIQKEVAKHFAVMVSDLSSKSRKQHIVAARQMGMFISHELTSLSLAKIGNNFGNRDHSTVLHACSKIKDKINKERQTKDNYDLIKLKLANL